MKKISPTLKKGLNNSALGRLKLAIGKQITGKEDYLPSPQAARHFLLKIYRENPLIGNIFLYLRSLESSNSFQFEKLTPPINLNSFLDQLNRRPLNPASFTEVCNCPTPFSKRVGFLIEVEEGINNGKVYTVTLLDEDRFPESIVGRMEFTAKSTNSSPRFDSLEPSGMVTCNETNFQSSPIISLAISVLHALLQNPDLQYIDLAASKNIILDNNTSPPIDKIFDFVIQQALRGMLGCTSGLVSLNLIKPFDAKHCLSFPKRIIELVRNDIQFRKIKQPLVVYWANEAFIMSDDYGLYMAYRELRYDKVPVVILGDYPSHLVRITKKGGAELIPPVLVTNAPSEVVDPLVELNKRFETPDISEEISHLYAVFMRFCQLLHDRSTKERELHEFILTNPILLDPQIKSIRSEVKLGKDYRIDLVAEYENDNRRVLLIELERSELQIFTNAVSPQPQAHVTHAYQQVEDWIRWWRENPKEVPSGLEASINPHGLVIIGRNFDWDDKKRKRLLSLNSNRDVQLITYDDLLDRLENLISNLENVQNVPKTNP